MLLDAQRAIEEGVILDEITDLNDMQREFLDASEEFGLPVLKVIHNFSSSIEDILDINYGATSRVLRFNERLLQDDFFEQNVGYLGVLFSAIKMLNYKSKLIPEINLVLNTVSYNTERYFVLQEILLIMEDIDKLSAQIERDFDDIYEYYYLKSCPRALD
mmetsp:Transcript_1989/g.3502  ORF Transcript_1989/g.3502 Transcript_1989/m.3502 type:complete len:160 (+) Transcript_1989:144-623(+)